MKTKLTTLALLSALLAFGQVTIDETVFVSPGGMFFSDMAINVTTNGSLEVEGELIANADIIGDDKLVLEPSASLSLNAGTLTLSHEVDEEFANLTLGTTGIVEVTPGNSLTLTGDLNNQNTTDGLKLLANSTGDYAQLLTTSTSALTAKGGTYAEQFFTADANEGWRQFGSPVAATFAQVDDDFEIIYPATPGSNSDQWNVKYWDAAESSTSPPEARGWTDITDGNWTFGPTSMGVGYTIYTGGAFDVLNGGLLDLTGAVGNGDYIFQTFPTSASPQQLALTEDMGWQLIPNPYPSNIDINALLNDVSGNFPLAYKGIHIWDAKNQQYVAISDNVLTSFTGTTHAQTAINIAPFQAFWVKGSATVNQTITLKNEHRTLAAQGNYFKAPPALIRLNAIASNGTLDQTIITFEQEADDDLDGRDAFKIKTINKEMHSLYTFASGNKIAINRKPMPEPDKHIPMQFEAPNTGEFTIDMVEETVSPAWSIELEDHKTGTIQNLRNDSYTFTNDLEFDGTRFTVHINKTGESITSANANRIAIYGNDAGINVKFGYFIASKTADVLITNLAGQILYNGTVDTEEPFLFPINDDVAMYVVHVIAGDKISQEKVVLGN